MVARIRRSLQLTTLIAVALSQPGDLRQAAIDNSDVRRAAMLIIEEQNKMPHRGSPWDWAVVQAFDEAQATRISDHVLNDEFRELNALMSKKLSPADAAKAFYDSWTSQMAGNTAEASEILKRYADQGIQLPFDP